MPKTSTPTSIVLPRELKAALKKEAEAKKWGVSMLIREILNQWVEAKKKWDKRK